MNLLLMTLLLPQLWAVTPPPQAYTKGLELMEKKHYEEAEQKFLDAIKINPSFVAPYIDFARASMLLKKRKEALEKLDQASKIAAKKEERNRIQEERRNITEVFFTNQSFQFYQNGLNFMRLERANPSIDNLEHALQIEPDNVAVLVAYAAALAKDNNISASQKAYEQALLLNPEKREAKMGLAEASLEKNPKRVLTLLDGIAMDNDVSEKAAMLYAKALVATGREKDGFEYLRFRAERNSDWVESLFWLGKNYSQNKDTAWNARKYLMIFLKREREHPGLALAREEAQTLLTRVNDSLQ